MESGQTIAGKYRLNRQIGVGGMASVWSATNIFTEREFAIKFMLPLVARSPDAARRFLLEAKISARINHPNIIEVIDVGQAEDASLFLVMELLTGQSLETAMRRQVPPMPVKDFVRFMVDVARALAAAHKSGVIHRDLKPTNIFLHKDRDGTVVPKILDFGVSKIIEDEANHALTMAGTVLGSPLYMSPEQAMGAPNLDGRTDIFAFGSIMFEALTGQRAFDAANFNALIVMIATQQPRKIEDYAPHMAESLRALVRECMVTDKTKRMASFDTVAERLARALPEIDASPMRLPSPYGAGPPSDPDATNAMPVLRADYALPQSFQNTPAPRSGNSPPGAFSTPSGTPPQSGALMALAALPPWARNAPKWALALGGSGVLLTFIALVILLATLTRAGGKREVAAASAASAVIASLPRASATPAASDPPTINFDSLPVAAGSSGKANAGKTGSLSVDASPGACIVTIDGTPHGSTPVDNLSLGAGVHRIECAPAGGKVRAASVTIQNGEPERYKFLLDDAGH